MGRKIKQPVSIIIPSSTTEIVAVQDGLPPFKRYLDIPSDTKGRKGITRWFFVEPTQEEIDKTSELHLSGNYDLCIVSAYLPYMRGRPKIRPPLFDYCMRKGLSENFSTDLVRLVINFLEGKHFSPGTISNHSASLLEFVDFILARTINHSTLVLTDIDKQLWLDYLENKENDQRKTSKTLFNNARGFFKIYKPTAIEGWLNKVSFRVRINRKPAHEHTSELADTKDYSDVVMYQLLALFIEGFQRRIGYLKRYETLTVSDMPDDWIYPGRKKRFLPLTKRGETTQWISETYTLLTKWLNDEDEGYQILIDHHIMHHKAGLVKKRHNGQLRGGFKENIASLTKSKPNPLVPKFYETMGNWHGYEYRGHKHTLLSFYVKKNTAKEPNAIINQIAYCLANLVMMQTGVNKEVVLSIPSKAENNKSILTRGDSLFISNNGFTEIELYGLKERTGASPKKIISIPIVINSPLHEMLIDYERYVKVDFDGPFFEINTAFKWPTAGKIINFEKIYPILNDSGEKFSSIDSTRFRKVFASGQLLNRLQGIKDGNELADKLRDDLSHGDLDVTLTNYLMKSSVSRGVIDAAIATITSEKLKEGLRFKGRISLEEKLNIKKKVFLCDCEDPTNPSHDIAIAEECKHYDLCLGCERSVITKMHLPYICARIIQYEEERMSSPHIWPALFEDRWNIAHDALDKYIAADQKSGQKLVNEAWAASRNGLVSLPPIIISNRS